MPLRVAVQMDPLESINISGDSTFAIMLGAQARRHKGFEEVEVSFSKKRRTTSCAGPKPKFRFVDGFAAANFALGGPIVKDRLWFFNNVRSYGNHQDVLNLFGNRNAGDPTTCPFTPNVGGSGIINLDV